MQTARSPRQQSSSNPLNFYSSAILAVLVQLMMAHSIPNDLSCILVLKSLEVTPGTGRQSNGFWWPPLEKSKFSEKSREQFRWKNGDIRQLTGSDKKSESGLDKFKTATVFTQWPDSQQLLILNKDATRHDVEAPSSWRSLSFEHQHVQGNLYRTKLKHGGSQRLLAAPFNPSVKQLIPQTYKYAPGHDQQGHSLPSTRQNGGLIGDLAILFAIGAFSAPIAQVSGVLGSSMHRNKWERHDFADGRSE